MMPIWLTLISLAALSPQAEATQRAQQARAQAVARQTLAEICPGQCTLLRAEVAVSEETFYENRLPGFEGHAVADPRVVGSVITVELAIDTTLPRDFHAQLTTALVTALSPISSAVRVNLQAVQFARPAREVPAAAAPIMVTLAAPASTEARPPAVPTTYGERFLVALAEAGPWLALAGLIGLYLALSRRRNARQPIATLPTAHHLEVPERSVATPPSSSLLTRCRQDPGLQAAVALRIITTQAAPDAAPLLDALGEQSLAPLYGSVELRPLLKRAVAALRDNATGRAAPALAQLEGLILDELERGPVDARLVPLFGIDRQSFVAVAEGLTPVEWQALVAHAPHHLRDAVVQTLPRDARRKLLQATLREAHALSDPLIERVLAGCAEAQQALVTRRRAAELLGDEVAGQSGPEQAETLDTLLADDPSWAAVIALGVVIDEDLLGAPEPLLRELCASVRPASIVTLIRGVEPALAERLTGLLPRYLRQMLDSDVGPNTPETLRAARREIGEAFLRLGGQPRERLSPRKPGLSLVKVSP